MAGAVVRMTQSGMGCPDWPRCFGKWIPPTKASELPPDFERYLKQQDIDHSFNAFHTWTEYINRLLGALLGLLLLIQLVWAIALFGKTKRSIIGLCVALVLLTGFQAWLGKRVVDANLASVKITTHMLVALLIAALSYAVIFLLQPQTSITSKKSKFVLTGVLLLLIVQIAMGTGVREQIDAISKALDYDNREYWIAKLDSLFYIHRSFSLVIAAGVIYLFVQLRKQGLKSKALQLSVASISAEIGLGIVMAYGNIPKFAQPLHLLFSALLFMALVHLWMLTWIKKAPLQH